MGQSTVSNEAIPPAEADRGIIALSANPDLQPMRGVEIDNTVTYKEPVDTVDTVALVAALLLIVIVVTVSLLRMRAPKP